MRFGENNLHDVNVLIYAGLGAAGLEPTASTSQMWRATKLRYAPKSQDVFTFVFDLPIDLHTNYISKIGFEPITQKELLICCKRLS